MTFSLSRGEWSYPLMLYLALISRIRASRSDMRRSCAYYRSSCGTICRFVDATYFGLTNELAVRIHEFNMRFASGSELILQILPARFFFCFLLLLPTDVCVEISQSLLKFFISSCGGRSCSELCIVEIYSKAHLLSLANFP